MNYENLCQICQEKSAPYKCPKCQMKYCCLTCYRDVLHESCSRKFDENEFFDSMNIDENAHENRTTTNNFVRERIEDILKRKADEKDFHNEEDDEEIEELFEHLLPTKDSEPYRETMGDIDDEAKDDGEEDEREECIASDEEPMPDLPDDFDESDENINQLWNCLTAEEKNEFKSMLSDGRISHLLNEYKPWKPWWLYKTQAPAIITDLETTTAPSSSPNLPDTIPTVESTVVPLPSLTSILPHIHVRFDVFEILFAYVLISVRYRGDFNSYIYESGMEFLHIASRHFTQKSDIFDEQEDPMSVLHTRISLLRENLQDEIISYRISEEFFVNLLADSLNIIHGPYPRQSSSSIYVLAALSDIKRFLVKIQEYKSSEEPTIIKELNKSTSTPINVFHTNRIIKPKIIVNKCTNSKLYIHRQSTVSKSSNPMKRKKDENLKTFNRKIVLNLSRKIDYLLSWTMTHSSRLLMLESELQGIEQDLRHQLNQYQRDKNCIEKNLKHIRLQQQTANGSKRIQEL
ncbi:unnamed protein product [Rotaria magnacalcarata]|uniref:HIT-type domain-containing protein n=3 Tax=Rotaria magnacalcarata TaxID=392030 RepID=A0A815QCB9_9BILA|nr:unnamed protein product [Rotaria magnacalcarata]CAF2265359.1 unnamed protein product [Rotaria magnacalcarata]CAF3989865.1 unnamed protein product [Rotaria magnacalcarata]